RGDEVGFGRFLGNENVTVEAIFTAEAASLTERVAGLDVVAIQDTSELSFGRLSGGRRGLGPVAFGSGRGLLLHPVLVLDASGGAGRPAVRGRGGLAGRRAHRPRAPGGARPAGAPGQAGIAPRRRGDQTAEELQRQTGAIAAAALAGGGAGRGSSDGPRTPALAA